MQKLTILILLCFLLSCGGTDSPTGSDLLNSDFISNTAITDPITLNFTSSAPGNSVQSVMVIVENKSYTANGGQVTIQRPSKDRAPIEVNAEGFLRRETYFLTNSHNRTFDLLPENTPNGVDVETIKSMLYSFGPAYPESTPDVIHRIEDTHISFVLSEDILKNSKATSAHEFAVEQLNEVAAGEITASIETEETAQGLVVQVRIDPEDWYFKENPEAFAVTRISGSSYAIEEATIIYPGLNIISTPGYNRQLAVHEFGHVLGLHHSHYQDDVMRNGYQFGLLSGPTSFSPRETDIVQHYLLRRKSGNAWEDNDRTTLYALSLSPLSEDKKSAP